MTMGVLRSTGGDQCAATAGDPAGPDVPSGSAAEGDEEDVEGNERGWDDDPRPLRRPEAGLGEAVALLAFGALSGLLG
jgi:hypothetical protein